MIAPLSVTSYHTPGPCFTKSLILFRVHIVGSCKTKCRLQPVFNSLPSFIPIDLQWLSHFHVFGGHGHRLCYISLTTTSYTSKASVQVVVFYVVSLNYGISKYLIHLVIRHELSGQYRPPVLQLDVFGSQ